MSALVRTILMGLMQVLAGVGVGSLVDKVAADKLPESIKPGENISPGFSNTKKLIWFLVTMVAGAIVWKFIARKLKIKI